MSLTEKTDVLSNKSGVKGLSRLNRKKTNVRIIETNGLHHPE